MLAGEQAPSYQQHLENLGLLTDAEKRQIQQIKILTRIQAKKEKKAAITKAESIIAMDQKKEG